MQYLYDVRAESTGVEGAGFQRLEVVGCLRLTLHTFDPHCCSVLAHFTKLGLFHKGCEGYMNENTAFSSDWKDVSEL